MLTFRLIARLDIRNRHLIKTVRLEGTRKIGDPAEFAENYDKAGIDEIIYLDVVASLYGRSGLIEFLRDTADSCFVPLCAVGGVSSVSDGREYLVNGADKIGLNTAATQRPELITELAHKFGSQAVTVQIDAKRKNGSWEAFSDGGRQPTGRDAIQWARDAAALGAGELLVTSIDREGTYQGFDMQLFTKIVNLDIPVIAAGGCGRAEDIVEAAKIGCSGAAMAGALHYGRVGLPEMREALARANIPVREAG